MAIQQGRDVIVAVKPQTVLGTEEAAGAGATTLIYKDGSAGFSPPTPTLIESTVNVGDGMNERGRRGTYNLPGNYTLEAACGVHSLIYPTYFRNAWTAAVTVTEATGAMAAATLSVSGSVITFSAGSVITAGLRAGDAVRFASGLDAANNGDWLRVRAATATTITVYEALTAVAGPVATYSFTIPPKITQSTQAHFLTVDQYYAQLDRSLVVHDVKGNSLSWSLSENQTLDITTDLLGAGYAYKAAGATSPHFTTPTLPSGTSLAFLDACFGIAGAEQLAVTGFTLGIDLSAQTLAVANACGPNPGKSPDVFQGNGDVTGQFTMAFEDFNLLTAAAAETQIDFIARFRDPNGTDVYQLSVMNAIMYGDTLSPLGADGAMTQTFDLEIGRDKRGGAFDRSAIKLFDTLGV